MNQYVNHSIKVDEVKSAAETLKGVSAFTPLTFHRNTSSRFDAQVFLKREDLQIVRSYKIRGAYNKIVQLSESERKHGIVCASAGNHAQGVAYSCMLLRIKGVIFMPLPTPRQKIDQVKMFGEGFVEIVLTGDTFDQSQHEAIQYAHTHQMPFIPPFDDLDVITGQATIGLEILEQANTPVDYLILPVGGGGLSAGVSSVFKEISPQTIVIGVEPAGAPSMSLSLENNQRTKLQSIDKFVDGAAVQEVGELTFSICKHHLDRMLTVDEGKVCETILELYNKDAIVVEPAGALALAALDQLQHEIKGKNVVAIVSGSNNDITRTEEIKERALLYKGLKHYFMVNFPQRSGALKEFVVEVLGENDDITYFEYTKKNSREKGAAIVGIEVKFSEDFQALKTRMQQKGFLGDYLNDKEELLHLLV